jgi:hypothetical protein
MLPVSPQPEPLDFDKNVRVKGLDFLRSTPAPTENQWGNHSYWRNALDDLKKAYKQVCAYCAHWIPHSTGQASVDHFVPKSVDPLLAYEWSNFRYVSARFNSRKGTRQILDPFLIEYDWFFLDLDTFLIKQNPQLDEAISQKVIDTIKTLRLNDDAELVAERQQWCVEYWSGEISFKHLQERFPFIAYEIQRQKWDKTGRQD